MIPAHIEEDIRPLIQKFKSMPWYQKSFFPKKLSVALEEYGKEPSVQHVFAVCDAYTNHIWFFQRVFFWFYNDLLSVFSGTETSVTFHILNNFNQKGSFSENDAQKNYEMLLQSRFPKKLAETLELLQEHGLLKDLLKNDKAEANRTTLATFAGQDDYDFKYAELTEFLSRLENQGLLGGQQAQANFESLVSLLRIDEGRSILRWLSSNDYSPSLKASINQTQFDALTAAPLRFHAFVKILNNLTNYTNQIPQKEAQFYVDAMFMDSEILLENGIGDLWSKIPYTFITRNHLRQVITIAQKNSANIAEGQRLVRDFIESQWIGPDGEVHSSPEQLKEAGERLLAEEGLIFGGKGDPWINALLNGKEPARSGKVESLSRERSTFRPLVSQSTLSLFFSGNFSELETSISEDALAPLRYDPLIIKYMK